MNELVCNSELAARGSKRAISKEIARGAFKKRFEMLSCGDPCSNSYADSFVVCSDSYTQSLQ